MNFIRKWLASIRLGSLRIDHTEGTMAIPTVQHEALSEEEQFRREHGYSKARVPLPWSEDISKHNAALTKEYDDEIEARKAAYAAGTYTPRFYVFTPAAKAEWARIMEDAMADGSLGMPIVPTFKDRPDWYEPNWDLELSLSPGRRVNVTQDIGKPLQPLVTEDEMATRRAVKRLESTIVGDRPLPRTVREAIGSRYSILEACHWNEQMADQVEAKACETFGVSSVDEPIPSGVTE